MVEIVKGKEQKKKKKKKLHDAFRHRVKLQLTMQLQFGGFSLLVLYTRSHKIAERVIAYSLCSSVRKKITILLMKLDTRFVGLFYIFCVRFSHRRAVQIWKLYFCHIIICNSFNARKQCIVVMRTLRVQTSLIYTCIYIARAISAHQLDRSDPIDDSRIARIACCYKFSALVARFSISTIASFALFAHVCIANGSLQLYRGDTSISTYFI